MTDRYDLAVIGGGTAGLAASQVGAAAGKRVVLITSGNLGGECTWNGCVPSKALIEAAHVRHTIARAGEFGIRVADASVDFPAVMEHVRDRIRRIAAYEDAAHLRATGIEVRTGHARLVDGRRIDVDGATVAAERILICTGSKPAVPDIPGLETVPFLTNETLFDVGEQPMHLVILGAGAIGLEMAQAFARLGSRVHVIDIVDKLLPREDPDAAAVVQRILGDEGVEFSLGVTIRAVCRDGDGIRVDVEGASGAGHVAGDALLVATGRRPNVEGLGLEEVGVRVSRTGVTVDDHMRTTLDGVYAAGDVTGIMPFTHAASYQGRLAADNALGKRRKASYRVVPWIIFTAPELAHVGLTEPQAREQHGDDIRVVRLPFTAVDRAVINRDTVGLIKVITSGKPVLGHAAGGAILGAHIVGPSAGELIHEFVIGMQVRAFAGRLAQAMHAYPATALAVQQAVAQLFAAGRATAGEMREDIEDDA